MNHKSTLTILTTLTLMLALLQAPYAYYYADGLFGFIVVIPYLLTGLILSLFLWYSYRKYLTVRSWYNLVALSAAMIVGLTSLLTGSEIVERMDWHLRFAERSRIVEEIRSRKLTPNVAYNDVMCKLSYSYFPPISVSDNEISIKHMKPALCLSNSILTAVFWTTIQRSCTQMINNRLSVWTV